MLSFNDSDILRLLTVLNGKLPDRIPYLDFLFSKKIMESVIGREVDYKVTLRADNSTKVEVDSKDFIDFIYAIGQDLAGFLILAPDDYKTKDGRTIKKSFTPVIDRDTLRSLQFPDMVFFLSEYKNRFESIINYCERFKIGATILTGAFFQDTHQLIGFENFMFKLSDDLFFINSVMDYFTEIYFLVAKFICSYDVPLFFFTDNIAYNKGPFFNPDLFKKLYIPRLKKILQPALDKNIPVLFDSDGDIEWIIPELINIGIKGIHPIDPGAMDIYKIKEKYGNRITIMGNVGQDFPLSTGTYEDVSNDVKKRIKILGKNGKYILQSSHEIGDNVKIENFNTMIKVLHEYGKY